MTEHDQETIERLAGDLGRRRAVDVDADRVADRVVARLRAGERLPGRHMQWIGRAAALAAAAALVIVAIGQPDSRTPAVMEVVSPVALSDLDTDGLTEALDSLTIEAPASEYVGWGIGTLESTELEQLLAAMEG